MSRHEDDLVDALTLSAHLSVALQMTASEA